jgi:hypothetical protein
MACGPPAHASPTAPSRCRGPRWMQNPWERTCPRRGRCIRWISTVRNTAFANRFAPTVSQRCRWFLSSRRSSWCCVRRRLGWMQNPWVPRAPRSQVDAKPVGADLSAKGPVHPLDFYRPQHRLREQVRSHSESAVPLVFELAPTQAKPAALLAVGYLMIERIGSFGAGS